MAALGKEPRHSWRNPCFFDLHAGCADASGAAGSDMAPAMMRLAEDSEVEAAIIITDGAIDYPQEAPPYDVLWVLPSWGDSSYFQPPYGHVVLMTPEKTS